jgi:hypothetical protein
VRLLRLLQVQEPLQEVPVNRDTLALFHANGIGSVDLRARQLDQPGSLDGISSGRNETEEYVQRREYGGRRAAGVLREFREPRPDAESL